MAKNYYVILGVSRNATPDQIKSAYRQRVMEYHPDHYGENCRPFLAIQEAYATLSDPQRRARYDQSIRRQEIPSAPSITKSMPAPEPLIPGQQSRRPADISLTRSFDTYMPGFDELFDRLWRNFQPERQPKGERSKGLTVEIPITSQQARLGGTFRVLVPVQYTCPTCRGLGAVGPYECWRCSGEGSLNDEYPISISIPPGIHDRYVVHIPLDRYGIQNIYLSVIFRISDYY